MRVNKFIPALPPCTTPSDCTAAANSCGFGRCRVAVPYSFDATPWANIPATTTARFVFWITNPSLAMYAAMNQRCRGLNAAQTAFQAESSYSSIEVWRMDPYEFCPIDPLTGVRRCPEDASATFRKLPGFIYGTGSMAEVCGQYFLVVAPTLTYVNDHNLAIMALNTTFENVDARTLRPINESMARSGGKPSRLDIHPDPRRGEGLPPLVLHPKVREDAVVQPVEQVHAVVPAPDKRAQMAHALGEPRLVPLVRAGDGQHLFHVALVEARRHFAQGVRVARQAGDDAIELVRSEGARALQLETERSACERRRRRAEHFGRAVFFSGFSFLSFFLQFDHHK